MWVFLQSLKWEHASAPRTRYHALDLCHTDETHDDLFSQYYALATGTVLFYDYFLTLKDEVR